VTEDDDLRFVDDAARRRYELRLGERLAGFIDYRTERGVVTLEYVEVDPAFQRRGFGSRLVELALEDIRARRLSVEAACPFAAWYLARHPEHADLVARDVAAG
jgi:predicted GNAT family acetyltransferase